MQTQRILLTGGCCLAFGAAFANIGLLLKTGTSVSHLTGDISKLSIDIVRATPAIWTEALHVTVAASAFFIGAFLAGFFIHNPTLDFTRPYGRMVTVIGLLLITSALVIDRFPVIGVAAAALGCGLQNSLAQSYGGIVLRTTHLTGLITDFGVTLGMRARGFDIPRWKILAPFLLISSFFLGGLACSVLFALESFDPILVAGIGYCAAGIGWTLFKHVLRPAFATRTSIQ
jgi:uncharacterized membrane protein YoaK (UPF0700 family)